MVLDHILGPNRKDRERIDKMQWIETTGKTVQEAIESALFQLGITRSELEYDVITEAKRGVLGLGKTEARIRARVKPATFSGKDEKSKTSRQRSSKGQRGSASTSTAKTPLTSPKGQGTKAKAAPSQRKDASKESISSQKGVETPPKADASKAGSRKTSNSRKESKGVNDSSDQNDRNSQSDSRSTPKEEGVSVPIQEQSKYAQDFLDGLLRAMEISADVRQNINEADEIANLSVEGSGLGILIGQKASTLSAIQDLTRTAVSRKTGATNGRILLDIGGYKAKRKVALEEFAKKVAQEVLDNQQERTLEPMNSSDRKVIHDTIGALEGVATKSVGDEPRRRVVVFLEKAE